MDAIWPDSRFAWTADALTLDPPCCPRGHRLTAKRVLFGSLGGHEARWVLCRVCGLDGREQPGQDGRVVWSQGHISVLLRVEPEA